MRSFPPKALITLISMILYGASITDQTDQTAKSSDSQVVLSLSQLKQFNSVIRRRKDAISTRHNRKREPPLPVYLGLSLHAKTRKRELVDTLYNLGLSISYDRVLSISTEMAAKVCKL